MLAEEQLRLHRLPDRPHMVAFGVIRAVPDRSPMIAFDNGQCSAPGMLLGEQLWVRTTTVSARASR
jgi:hypothetical protein